MLRLIRKLTRRLSVLAHFGSRPGLRRRLALLEARTQYLEYQLSSTSSLARRACDLAARDTAAITATKESFSFQWDRLPDSADLLANPSFARAVPQRICQYTGLSPNWFAGKSAADVGCGNGRFSYGLCVLGATVLSIDQSRQGLDATRSACGCFAGHRTLEADILRGTPVPDVFDLVWCYGVLHHTGDTHRAFQNLVPMVAPGGYLFLMIYGEPRFGELGDYLELNLYEYWRRTTSHMSHEEKLAALRKGMNDDRFPQSRDADREKFIHGYFDAISPAINDLHPYEEIVDWLNGAGFVEIRRTVEARNHHIVARKAPR